MKSDRTIHMLQKRGHSARSCMWVFFRVVGTRGSVLIICDAPYKFCCGEESVDKRRKISTGAPWRQQQKQQAAQTQTTKNKCGKNRRSNSSSTPTPFIVVLPPSLVDPPFPCLVPPGQLQRQVLQIASIHHVYPEQRRQQWRLCGRQEC